MKIESGDMSRTARHYFIFETASGFCGLAWSALGVTRFQLPASSAEAAERLLLRRAPGAERGRADTGDRRELSPP